MRLPAFVFVEHSVVEHSPDLVEQPAHVRGCARERVAAGWRQSAVLVYGHVTADVA